MLVVFLFLSSFSPHLQSQSTQTHFHTEKGLLSANYVGPVFERRFQKTMSDSENGNKVDISETCKQILSTVAQLAKLSSSIPSAEDLDFFSSCSPAFSKKRVQTQTAVLKSVESFLQLEKVSVVPRLVSQDDSEVLDSFADIVDITDYWIDSVTSTCDKLEGKFKSLESEAITFQVKTGSSRYSTIRAVNLAKPQISFKDKIDNSLNAFVPKIKEKPNALIPLEQVFSVMSNSSDHANEHIEAHLGTIGRSSGQKPSQYPHPYEYEIDNFKYVPRQLESTAPIVYLPLESTPCTWVDTPLKLKEMLEKLKKATEIAVDLEHHSQHSFQGFLCLMQVSTRTEDFLVDTIELRSELHILNEVFTDPKIIKVMHGADSDVQWLQRDLGVYIVNLFDSFHASRVLLFPRHSLAHLLQHYCAVTADKQYQRADWRIRPLPAEMIHYAREDTHYLLYMYDRLKTELIERSNANNELLLTVLLKSREVCKKLYEKKAFDKDSHLDLIAKKRINLNPQQTRVFAELCRWRDQTAREQDESENFVLPIQIMTRLAEIMPETTTDLYNACSPFVPPLVHANGIDIVQLIVQAKADPSVTVAPRKLGVTFDESSIEPKKTAVKISAASSELKSRRIPTLTPGLTEDELFKEAGWVPKDDEEGFFTGIQAEYHPSHLAAVASSLFTTLAAISDSEDEAQDAKRQKLNQVRSIVEGSSPFSSSAMRSVSNAVAMQISEQEVTQADLDKKLEVPSSMEEIYKLSNMNRMRNKEKKKLKEGRGGSYDSDDEDSDGEGSSSGHGRDDPHEVQDESSMEDTEKFMKSIGWLDGDGDASDQQRRSRQGTGLLDDKNRSKTFKSGLSADGQPKTKKAKVHSKTFPPRDKPNFKPFDYSKAPPAQGIQSLQQQGSSGADGQGDRVHGSFKIRAPGARKAAPKGGGPARSSTFSAESRRGRNPGPGPRS